MTEKRLDISENKFKRLRLFTMHGVAFHDETNGQAQGDCPFCGKDGHFYANVEKLLWDCKTCGEKGNPKSFLEKINFKNKEQLTQTLRLALADERKLPVQAFTWPELGYNHGQYTLAVKGADGVLTDLRIYRMGSKVLSTSGMQTGLFGLQEMLKSKDKQVYICEGEWDTIAMQWLLSKLNKPGRAICAPGANTFKPEWADYFSGKDVVVCYDHDSAGLKGEMLVLDRLVKKTKSIHFLHWPQGLPDGYDLRDHISKIAVMRKKPKKAFRILESYFKDKPRTQISEDEENLLDAHKAPEVDPSVSVEDVFRIYEEHLHDPNKMGIEICLISALASVFDTDPIWLFLVAPPSSGKTAIISGFRYLASPYDDMALFLSHITTHSLVSGMETKRGDPGIFAQLNGNKMAFFIKDFTTVVSMRDSDKEDIYAQLRDAYDGYTMKSYGNGVKREYNNLKFSLIAGVTEMIYDESVNFQALGERFAKINIGRGGQDVEFSRKAIEKSIRTRDGFKEMEDKCARTVYSCVKNMTKRAADCGYKLPKVNSELSKAIIGISLYVSAMRGCVSRDKYRRDYIKSAPYAETGIRFAKMLAAIASVRAFMFRRTEATLEDLPLLKKIALDTINQRDEELVRNIYFLNKDEATRSYRRTIEEQSSYTPYTIRCVLEDLVMLKILERVKGGTKHFYKLTPQMLKIVEEAKLYSEETIRPKKRKNKRIKLILKKLKRVEVYER